MPAMKRVGHKGADHVAPGNTIESFRAALEHGVDMIEFDVLRLRDGRLVLAHDYEDAAKREPLALEEGLDHFAGEAYAGVELDVELKLPGYEREGVDGVTTNDRRFCGPGPPGGGGGAPFRGSRGWSPRRRRPSRGRWPRSLMAGRTGSSSG